MGGGCGTTNTFYANQVAPAVMKEYGGKGGCGCMGGPVAVNLPKKPTKIVGGAGCSGQPTMLRALGIMAGGRRRSTIGTCANTRADAGISGTIGTRRRSKGGSCAPCALGRLRGGYKPTRKNLAALRKYRAGKSIGFTMRSSLKAKGLIPRANGTKRVSNKYR
jgi:hypothetical protein